MSPVEVPLVALELKAETVGVIRRAVGSAEHEATVDEAGSDEEALLVLRLPMCTEHGHGPGVEADHVASLRLRELLQDDAALERGDLMADDGRRRVEIEKIGRASCRERVCLAV